MAAPVVQSDYEGLEQIAQRFNQQADVIAQLIQSVKGAMDPLQSNWLGDAKDAFFSEMEEDVSPGTQRLQELFAESAAKTAEIARVLEEAEEEARNVFNSWRA